MFKTPFSFQGRIRRLEYGLSYLIYIAFAAFLSSVGTTSIYIDGFNLMGLVFIPLYWFLIAQGAKRCHDRGNSGWFQIIPFYGLWMLFAEGDKNRNRFGPNPKEPEEVYHEDILDDDLV